MRVANGLSEERFRRQWKEIERLNDRLAPFRILKAVELEIKSDGSLDFERKFLDEFDLVGASLHQNFRQDADKLTERAVKALSHPSVDFLCHPTNRLIGRREGNPIDLAKVIRTAKENGKMLEIDGEPAQAGPRRGVGEEGDGGGGQAGDRLGRPRGRRAWTMWPMGSRWRGRAWLEAKHVMNTESLRELLNAVS